MSVPKPKSGLAANTAEPVSLAHHDHRTECGPAVNSLSASPGSLLTIREAAALLRLSESTIRNAVRLGQLRAFRFGIRGGTIRISPADLDDYVAGAATTPRAPRMLTATGGQFKHLDASKLLSAWRRQGVLGDRPDDSNVRSSEWTDDPSTRRGS